MDVKVIGFTDEPGHTEYLLTTEVEAADGRILKFSSSHRFSEFADLQTGETSASEELMMANEQKSEHISNQERGGA